MVFQTVTNHIVYEQLKKKQLVSTLSMYRCMPFLIKSIIHINTPLIFMHVFFFFFGFYMQCVRFNLPSQTLIFTPTMANLCYLGTLFQGVCIQFKFICTHMCGYIYTSLPFRFGKCQRHPFIYT